jgi:hypothetical protein
VNSTHRSVAFVLALAGCSASSGPSPIVESGSRLEALYYELDGLRVFVGFRDIARNEDCAFGAGLSNAPGPGGVSYCLPSNAGLIVEYSDPACTQPIVEVPDGMTPKEVVIAPDDTCAAFPTVRAIGAVVNVDTIYQRDSAGGCYEIFASGNVVREVGDEIPIDDFVRAVETETPARERIGRVDLVADDGARLAVAGYDEARRETVLPWTNGNRWLARGIAAGDALLAPGSLYADTHCRVGVAQVFRDEASCPFTIAAEVSAGSCGQPHFNLHQIGASVAPSQLFLWTSDGYCVNAGFSDDDASSPVYYEMADVLSTDDLEELTVVTLGRGRVIEDFYADHDGDRVLPAGTFHDTLLGVDCALARANDGRARCMPPMWRSSGFADASCTELMTTASAGNSCGDAPAAPPGFVSLIGDDGFAAGYAVGRPEALEEFEVQDGACTKLPGQIAGFRLTPLGADHFAPFTDHTTP